MEWTFRGVEILNINENSHVLIFNSENFSAVLKVITKGKKSLVCDQTYSMQKLKCSFKIIEILPNKIHWFLLPPFLLYIVLRKYIYSFNMFIFSYLLTKQNMLLLA